ncbi:Hsp70 family protein [Plantactinospora sp. B6F1]|uniref:Hsp70 family protein n=1 Tax=Plantactinospora sp. B6F1 TaxID=3158971 RepID=UPI0032D9050E
MVVDKVRVGVDFGTSSTAAVLAGPGAQSRSLLFDGSPLLPSAVFADADGRLLTGRDALHSARTQPERFEPAPKRCVDHGTVLLGERAVPVAEMIAAVLRRVAVEADQVAGERVRRAVLTHPVSWGPVRRQTLLAAASTVFAEPALVTEPVAAASYFLTVAGRELPVGSTAMVYDLGAGTFDATVVRRSSDGFEVLATGGLSDVGGLDIDAALVAALGEVYRLRDEAAWSRLLQPTSAADRRASRGFWDDVRVGKELLSRAPTALLHVPIVDDEAVLGREQLDRLAEPILERTVSVAAEVLASAGVPAASLAGLFLVGGASRMPLVGTLVHRRLGIPPVLVDQPELVVASGSVHAPLTARVESPAGPAPAPKALSATKVLPAPEAESGPRALSAPRAAAGPGGGPARGDELAPGAGAEHVSVPEAPAEPAPAPMPARPEPIAALPLEPVAALPLEAVAVAPPAGVTSRGTGAPPGLPPPAWTARPGVGWQRWLSLAIGVVVVLALVGYAVWNIVPSNRGTAGGPGTPTTSAGPPTPTPTPVAPPQATVLRLPAGTQAHTLVLSPDGKRLAAIDTYTIRFFTFPDLQPVGKQLTVGKETRRAPGAGQPVHREDFETAAFSPDGRMLATYDSGVFGYVQVWDVASGRRIRRISDKWWASCLAFSPKNDRLVACAGPHEYVRLWSVSGWRQLGQVHTDNPAAIRNVAFSPDGRLLVTDGGAGNILFWDVATRKRLKLSRASAFPSDMVPAADPGVAMAFSPDGRTLATGGVDGTVRLWNVSTRQQVAVLDGHHANVVQVAFAPDGTLATSGSDWTVRLWDVTARRQIGSVAWSVRLGEKAADLAFSPDSRTVSLCVGDSVLRWDVAGIRAYAETELTAPSGSPSG